MSDSFEEQIRYFSILIRQFGTNPGVNKHKLDAAEYYRNMLEKSGSNAAFRDFVQRNGNMYSFGQADILDRYENRVFLYKTLGNEKTLKAEKLRLETAQQARTHQELAAELERVEPAASALTLQENKAIGCISGIMKAVFQLSTDPKGSKGEARTMANLKTYWGMLKESDPDASWEKLCTYKPYRNRLPFTDSQLAVLEKTFREAEHGLKC